jgi:hypothetical protein
LLIKVVVARLVGTPRKTAETLRDASRCPSRLSLDFIPGVTRSYV